MIYFARVKEMIIIDSIDPLNDAYTKNNYYATYSFIYLIPNLNAILIKVSFYLT